MYKAFRALINEGIIGMKLAPPVRIENKLGGTDVINLLLGQVVESLIKLSFVRLYV